MARTTANTTAFRRPVVSGVTSDYTFSPKNRNTKLGMGKTGSTKNDNVSMIIHALVK